MQTATRKTYQNSEAAHCSARSEEEVKWPRQKEQVEIMANRTSRSSLCGLASDLVEAKELIQEVASRLKVSEA